MLSVERIPALAAASSSCRFGQMPDIAAMPVDKKTTANVKQPHTLLFEELDKVYQVPHLCCFHPVKWHFPFWEVPKYRNAQSPTHKSPKWELGGASPKSGYAFRNLICNSCRIKFPFWELDFPNNKVAGVFILIISVLPVTYQLHRRKNQVAKKTT